MSVDTSTIPSFVSFIAEIMFSPRIGIGAEIYQFQDASGNNFQINKADLIEKFQEVTNSNFDPTSIVDNAIREMHSFLGQVSVGNISQDIEKIIAMRMGIENELRNGVMLNPKEIKWNA